MWTATVSPTRGPSIGIRVTAPRVYGVYLGISRSLCRATRPLAHRAPQFSELYDVLRGELKRQRDERH